MVARAPIAVALVDDDVGDRMLTVRPFSEAGLSNKVVELEDGQALLDLLCRRSPFASTPLPGLVLLDLRMPRLGGREALDQLRADPRYAELPVVILTESDDPQDIRNAYLRGATSYVAKPVTPDAIDRIVVAVDRLSYGFDHNGQRCIADAAP